MLNNICYILTEREVPFEVKGNMVQVLIDDQPDFFIIIESDGINVSFDEDNQFKFKDVNDFLMWFDI